MSHGTLPNITLYRPSVEYIRVQLTANVVLDGPIELSFDKINWLAAEWESPIGKVRTCRYLADTSDRDTVKSGTVYVRVVDFPEISVFPVGTLTIK